MPANNQDTQDLISKIAVYVCGTLLGLGAKLATMNKERALTYKEVIFQSVVAMACAWLVWFLLYKKIPTEMAAACSVVVGRFGDSILIALGKAVKSWIIKNQTWKDDDEL